MVKILDSEKQTIREVEKYIGETYDLESGILSDNELMNMIYSLKVKLEEKDVEIEELKEKIENEYTYKGCEVE